MFLLGHISLLPFALILYGCTITISATDAKLNHRDYADLMFSDTHHGDTHYDDTHRGDTPHAAEQQHVLFINHGGGAMSQIRRTAFIPQSEASPRVASAAPPSASQNPPFSHHVNQYPNHIFDGGFVENPEHFNIPGGDVQRLYRRVGDNTGERPPPPPPPPPAQTPPSLPSSPKSQIGRANSEEERGPIQNHHLPSPRDPSHHEPPYNPSPQLSPFFNFGNPEIFPFFDGAFTPIAQPPSPFQRRRLTLNNQLNDFHPNSIGYPSYTYYKGGGDDNPSLTNWPKIFKFTDGRANLNEFEKQKKHGKVKFTSKETYFDNISRDSFLILHGGTYTY